MKVLNKNNFSICYKPQHRDMLLSLTQYRIFQDFKLYNMFYSLNEKLILSRTY